MFREFSDRNEISISHDLSRRSTTRKNDMIIRHDNDPLVSSKIEIEYLPLRGA